MQIFEKLKQLRHNRNLTQWEVAEQLGVSAQTVSKWERGLLSPDVRYLPALAVLYRTSIDAMFDMQSYWDEAHRKQFLNTIQILHQKGDKEGVFWAWISEIELQPDRFSDYITVMIYAFHNDLFGDANIKRLLQLTEYARRKCADDDIRNEIYRTMLQITSHTQNPELRQKTREFYEMLPRLAHSREFFFDIIENSPEARRAQTIDNLHRITSLVNHCIFRLITPEMTPTEKIYYHKKAVKVLEAVWDQTEIGFYHLPLLYNYYSIVLYSLELGDISQADWYFEKLKQEMRKHIVCLPKNEKERQDTLVSLKKLINHMKNNASLDGYQLQVQELEMALYKEDKNE